MESREDVAIRKLQDEVYKIQQTLKELLQMCKPFEPEPDYTQAVELMHNLLCEESHIDGCNWHGPPDGEYTKKVKEKYLMAAKAACSARQSYPGGPPSCGQLPLLELENLLSDMMELRDQNPRMAKMLSSIFCTLNNYQG